jgi:hypothetical protein
MAPDTVKAVVAAGAEEGVSFETLLAPSTVELLEFDRWLWLNCRLSMVWKFWNMFEMFDSLVVELLTVDELFNKN